VLEYSKKRQIMPFFSIKSVTKSKFLGYFWGIFWAVKKNFQSKVNF